MTSYLVKVFPFIFLALSFLFIGCDSKPKKARKTVYNDTNNKAVAINYIYNDSNKYDLIPLSSILELKSEIDSMVTELSKDENIRGIAVKFTDLRSNHTFEINPELRFVPASLLKIPILIALFKLEELSPGSIDQVLPLRMIDPGTIDMNLEENHNFPYDESKLYKASELGEIMMTHSDNIATYTLLVYLDEKKPGLLQKVESDLHASIPETATNKDDIIKIGHFSEMLFALYNSNYLTKENSIQALKYLTKSRYGQGFRKSIPSNILMAHKYGVRFNVDEIHPEFPVQLHQVALIYHPKYPFILSAMTKGKNIEDLRMVLQQVSKKVFAKIDSNH